MLLSFSQNPKQIQVNDKKSKSREQKQRFFNDDF